MNDKELLEAAARAAGIDYGWQHIYDDYEGCTADKWDWNPLTDDGDALRLLVKLGLRLYTSVVDGKESACGGFYVAHRGDAFTATRRAIVRAAAAMDSGHSAGDKPPQVGLD